MTDSPPQSAAPGEQRVSTLVGDRLCIQCYYNLSGQPVMRDGHYNMLIVRCPECGTVASLQEHPLLGRWAMRWAVVLAGLWAVVVLGVWLISAGVTFGLAHNITGDVCEHYAGLLSQLQRDWAEDKGQFDQQQYMWIDGISYASGDRAFYTALNQDWWQLQDADALLAAAGGWTTVADWRGLLGVVNVTPVLFAMGCVWALLLPQWRRIWLPLWAFAIVALGLLINLIVHLDPFAMAGRYYFIGDVIDDQLGFQVRLIVLALSLPAIMLGLISGRTLARLLVRALLPPRLRGSLAGLWLIDGIEPPLSRRQC